MGHVTIFEKFSFLLLATLAIGITWNVARSDNSARLATIVLPVENVRYVVDYGSEKAVHARDISFEGLDLHVEIAPFKDSLPDLTN